MVFTENGAFNICINLNNETSYGKAKHFIVQVDQNQLPVFMSVAKDLEIRFKSIINYLVQV